MITLFISKYTRELTKMKRFLAQYDLPYEIVPLQASDQCLTVQDYQAMVDGLGLSYGHHDDAILLSQKKREKLAPKLASMYFPERVAYLNEHIEDLRGLILVDPSRNVTLIGYDWDDVRILVPRHIKKQAQQRMYEAVHRQDQGGMIHL